MDSASPVNLSITNLTSSIAADPLNPNLYRDRSYLYYELQRFSDAQADVARTTQLFLQRSKLRRSENLFAESHADATAAIELSPYDPRCYLERAATFQVTQRPREAIDAISSAIDLDPLQLHPYRCRGGLLVSLTRDEEALEDFCRVIHLGGSERSDFLNRGIVYQNLRRFEESIHDYAVALQLKPTPDLFYKRAHCFNSLGFRNDAVADLNEAIRMDSANGEYALLRGSILSELERREEALEDFDNAVRLGLEREHLFRNRAIVLNHFGRKEEAICDLSKAIEMNDGTDAQLRGFRGELFRHLKRYAEAASDLTEAIRLDPNNTLWYLNRAFCFDSLSRYEEAVVDLTSLIRLGRTNAKTYYDRASIFKKLNDFAQVVQDTSTAIRKDPSQDRFFGLRAKALMYLERYEEELDDRSEIIRMTEANGTVSNAASFHSRAKVLFRLGRPEEALSDAEKAVRLDPTESEHFKIYAAVLDQLGHLEEALENITKAIELDPMDVEQIMGRACTLQKLERYEEAIREVTKAIRMDPDNSRLASFYGRRSDIQHRFGNLESAFEDRSTAIALGLKTPESYGDLANVALELCRWDVVVESASEAIRLDSLNPKFYQCRAMALHELERIEESLADTTTAVRLEPSNAESFCNRCVLLLELNRIGEALDDISEAIRLDPTSDKFYSQRSVIHGKNHRHVEAVNDLSEAIKLNPNKPSNFVHRALSLNELMRHDEAEEDALTAVSLDPKSERWWVLGIVRFFRSGEGLLDSAVECFLKARSLGFHTRTSWTKHRKDTTMLWMPRLIWRYRNAIVKRRVSPRFVSPLLHCAKDDVDVITAYLALGISDLTSFGLPRVESPALWALTFADLIKSLSSLVSFERRDHVASRTNDLFSVLINPLSFSADPEILSLDSLPRLTLVFYVVSDNSTIARWLIRDGTVEVFDARHVSDFFTHSIEEEIAVFSSHLNLGSRRGLLRGLVNQTDNEGSASSPRMKKKGFQAICQRQRKCCVLLYDFLLGGFETFLDVRSDEETDPVVIIPDGALFRVPFGCLLNRTTDRYFVEDHDFVVCPSIHLLQSHRRKKFLAEDRANSSNLALICRNEYSDNPLISQLACASSEVSGIIRALSRLSSTNAIRSVCCLSGHSSIPSQISHCINTLRPRILHIAGHSAVEQLELRTSSDPSIVDVEMLLEEYRRTGMIGCAAGEVLRASDVSESFDLQQTKLVYLSSCALGDGNLLADGMNGFYRACLDAGCESVMCALWPIFDRVSEVVSVQFYECVANGNRFSKALMKAICHAHQVLVRRADSTAMVWRDLPSLWAGFQVLRTERNL